MAVSIAVGLPRQRAERPAQRAEIGLVVFPMADFMARERVADGRRVVVKATKFVYSRADVGGIPHQILVTYTQNTVSVQPLPMRHHVLVISKI